MNEQAAIKVPLAIAVLAGGLSRRMGQDKSSVPLHGRPLIEHTLARLESLRQAHPDAPLMIIGNNSSAYAYLGVPVLPDVLPDRSSLGGLYSALWHSPAEHTLCVACDMPFLNALLLEHLIGLAEAAQAVVPRIGGRFETLHAVYNKTCLEPFREALAGRGLKISAALAGVQVRPVDEDELRRFDPDLRSFANVNTPEDLDRANRLPLE
ncbi:MAG TPA: molybdenum cofactor guanylyltransferase [Aggregatilineaceae bacterium]|nr:molybdenum cofactor guanylyltransferase [Aggregatilineaceae bacterium]